MKVRKILLLIVVVLSICTGCNERNYGESQSNGKADILNERQQIICADSEQLAGGYRDIYEKAQKDDKRNSLELKLKIAEYFRNKGYAAVDMSNQIDMVNYEKVEEFCGKAENAEKAEIIIFSIMDEGGFVRYDMESGEGEIEVIVSSLKWENHNPHTDYYHEFKAYTWKYTENGYFFIEEYHPPGFDGAPGQKGFRVKPLNQICRELNRKYVIPIGYERNNMLIVDWNEQDYTNLEFYDLYELMHRLKYDTYAPYNADYMGAEYEIPKSEFEEVMQTYFRIDSEEIQKNTVYHSDSQTYRYRPRGLYDYEMPYEPYPEVVDYEEQSDGTLKLFIQAVWERKEQDCAFASELVVRPLENGQCQYVSNQVIHSEENSEAQWYMPRLSDDEWLHYYKELALQNKKLYEE